MGVVTALPFIHYQTDTTMKVFVIQFKCGHAVLTCDHVTANYRDNLVVIVPAPGTARSLQFSDDAHSNVDFIKEGDVYIFNNVVSVDRYECIETTNCQPLDNDDDLI